MIDTIVLRIHGVKRYRNILKSLDQLNTKGFTTSIAHVKGKDIDKLRSQGHQSPGEILNILKKQGSNEFLIRAKFAKAPNSSGHYYFVYRVDYIKDFIELNFSVPKYVYGSNVLLFVDHIGDKNYSFHECWGLEHNLKAAFDRFRRFLMELFKFQFINVTVDPEHVEVHRIDVCFNQVFRSQELALKYLEYQKRKSKKYARNEGVRVKEYETSIMYVTKRYSAMIYHKGTEYRKNDSKEHLRFNKRKRAEYFKTDQFQAFADRILRYELTLRTDMINYLHKQYVFRKHCPHFQVAFKEYQRVEAIKQKNERIAKKIGELPEEQRDTYRKQHPYEKLSKEARDNYKYVLGLMNRRTHFTLAVNEGIALYNRQTLPGEIDCNIAKFSKELFEL